MLYFILNPYAAKGYRRRRNLGENTKKASLARAKLALVKFDNLAAINAWNWVTA
jgi:hypothetical protein